MNGTSTSNDLVRVVPKCENPFSRPRAAIRTTWLRASVVTFLASGVSVRLLRRVMVADTQVNVAEVIVQRRWIAYFRAGQRS
jgi:hypothetical protein